ncbi:MAG: ABC transporter substrate-binding protein [Chloroflexota bacterium]
MRWTAACSVGAALLLQACQPAAGPSPTAPPPLAASPAPPATATQSAPAKLTIDLDSELESLDPYLAYGISSLSIHHNIFDFLLERDAQGNLAPGLAESWTAVDPTTLEFKLRHNVVFHNGEPFTGESVRFSAQRMLDPNLNSGVRSRFASINEVKVVDPFTVRFLLARPDPQLLDSLTNQMAMLPPSFGQAGSSLTPVGTGPFKFVEWVHGDHVTVQANDRYWAGSVKGTPRVQTVVFRPVPVAGTRLADVQSGQADLVVGLTPDQTRVLQSAGQTGPRVLRADLPGYQYIFFNERQTSSPLADARVRQALNYAIDRRALTDTLLGGTVMPLTQAVGPLTPGYDPTLAGFGYDPSRARRLLADAGVGSGFDLTLDVAQADRTDLIDAVAAQLSQVGVRVTIESLEGGAFNDRWLAHGLSGLFFVRWATFADPGTLNLLASCNGFLSFSCAPAAEPFLAQGESTFDQATRTSAYQAAMRAYNDDPFAIDLTTLSSLYGVSARVSGWAPSAAGYLYATDATLN